MNESLRESKCVPCQLGAKRLTEQETRELIIKVPGWRRGKELGVDKLLREFNFVGFDEAFAFSSHVADLAREEDHHPTMIVEWGKVTIHWWTHKVNGLHLNDFIMAAKTDEIFGQMAGALN